VKKTIFILVVVHVFMLNIFAQNQILTVGKMGTTMNESILIFQNDHQLTIRLELNEIELLEVETEYGKAFIATSGNAPLMLQEGFPEIFFLTAAFIIPDTGGSALEISYGKYVDFENIEIVPSKGSLSRNIDTETVSFVKGDVYQKDAFYPETLASLREPFIMRDLRGLSVDVYPIQYNPVTKVLRIYSEITVTVISTRDEGINEFNRQKRHKTIDPQFNEMYNNLFINYSSLSRGYPTGEEGELLIICHPDFMTDMKPYIDWKRTIGRKTTMVSTATTGAIKDSIKNYHY
jgi:gingipain R